MAQVFCPGCRQLLEHDRGYLPMHATDLVRGQLVTGSKICGFSNKKIVTECAVIEYKNECDQCGCETTQTITEQYPGALEKRDAFIEVDCWGCMVPRDGWYCEICKTELKEVTATEWHIIDPHSDEVKVVYTDILDAQAEVDALIAKLDDTGAQAIELPHYEELQPGWYPVKGHREECLDSADGLHHPEFKQEYHHKVLVSDGHTIQEEPDMTREEEEAALHG